MSIIRKELVHELLGPSLVHYDSVKTFLPKMNVDFKLEYKIQTIHNALIPCLEMDCKWAVID